MRTEGYYDSCGKGRIHYWRWSPPGAPRGIVQIIHGIAEFAERYEDFAAYLCNLGFLVVAEDHMGHGQSVAEVPGYFHGGWFAAVDDSFHLLELTRQEFPDLPYVILGHSMGSFMTRSILCRYPDSGISGAILSGTGWQPRAMLPVARQLCRAACRKGEKEPSPALEKMAFGSYNKKVEHQQTKFDWLSRDRKAVQAYVDHPLCGFTATAGLMRDLMEGLIYIEDPKNLAKMKKDLPVFFVSGGDDPVGNYGKGVLHTVEAFQAQGMEQVSHKLYPLCRHEILNEINREEIYGDLGKWLMKTLFHK